MIGTIEPVVKPVVRKERLYKCRICGAPIDNLMARGMEAKQGWHYCQRDGWISEEHTMEFIPVGAPQYEPLQGVYMNRDR